MTWIQTRSGKHFDLADPKPQDVLIEDVAHALAKLDRFCGHAPIFYSVGQHSLLVSRLCPREHALAGLLHDAAEAYVGDVTRPLRKCRIEDGMGETSELGFFVDQIESRVGGVIAVALGLTVDRALPPMPDIVMALLPAVRAADDLALVYEAKCLHGEDTPASWGMDYGEELNGFSTREVPPWVRDWITEKPWRDMRDQFLAQFHHLTHREVP